MFPLQKSKFMQGAAIGILSTLATLLYVPNTLAIDTSAQPFVGEQAFENYTVRYNVFNSTFVPADIARAHGIKRSKYESLLNVSVSHAGKYGALPAAINGTVKNLIQQQKILNFIEIKETNATYYLAPLSISGEEVVHISLELSPIGSDETLTVNFNKTLYSDP